MYITTLNFIFTSTNKPVNNVLIVFDTLQNVYIMMENSWFKTNYLTAPRSTVKAAYGNLTSFLIQDIL